jgi:hypothetical protein
MRDSELQELSEAAKTMADGLPALQSTQCVAVDGPDAACPGGPERLAAGNRPFLAMLKLGNVFAYTLEGAGFRVAARPRDGGGAAVVVADTGPVGP